jgi:hypothetical protein
MFIVFPPWPPSEEWYLKLVDQPVSEGGAGTKTVTVSRSAESKHLPPVTEPDKSDLSSWASVNDLDAWKFLMEMRTLMVTCPLIAPDYLRKMSAVARALLQRFPAIGQTGEDELVEVLMQLDESHRTTV